MVAFQLEVVIRLTRGMVDTQRGLTGYERASRRGCAAANGSQESSKRDWKFVSFLSEAGHADNKAPTALSRLVSRFSFFLLFSLCFSSPLPLLSNSQSLRWGGGRAGRGVGKLENGS